MALSLEEIASGLFKDAEHRQTADCPSVDTLAEYIEHTIPSESWHKVENHLRSCLYCLNKLVEIREILYLRKNAEPLPRALQRKLLRVVMGKSEHTSLAIIESLGDRLRSALDKVSLTLNSKYTWQAAFSVLLACLAVKFPNLYKPHVEDNTQKIASEVLESAVTVRLADAKGATVQRARGLIVDLKGYVILPLRALSGAVTGEATLTDGSTIPVKGRGAVDENNALAVIKLANSTALKAPNLVDYIRTGDEVLAVSQDEGSHF